MTKAIKEEGDLTSVRGLINQIDNMSGEVTPEVTSLLESRDKDGKNALLCAVELNKNEIVDFLLDNYENLNLKARDTISGDCLLHKACRNKNTEIAR